MNKHLKYIDGTSDKFWQIEVNDASYTVTYGRNGTSGTAQTKSFASNDECLKAAEKLLNEKIKKGYSENGEVVVSQATAKSVPSKSTSTISVNHSKANIEMAIQAYDAMIKAKDLSAVLPFLKEYAKGNVEALKKHIKKCKRYWTDYIDLSLDPEFKKRKGSDWGQRGDEKQADVIILSAIALFNKADINAWDEAFELLKKAKKPLILEVLQWAQPTWIADFLLDRAKKNEWNQFPYLELRFLETHGFVNYQPELYALSLSSFNEWSSNIKTRAFIKEVVNDKVAYERDVPELFNYETNLHNDFFRDHENEPYNAHSTWGIIYDTLLAEGKINRDQFIEKSILIQSKDWNNALKSFFRKRLTDLSLSADELLPYQENIFACLQHAYAPVVNFAMDLGKQLYEHKAFNVRSFLDWMEPVMMSSAHKGAIKTALSILEKLNKLHPELNKRITSLIADVYVVPDLGLQEKATKLLLKIASEKDTDLSEKLNTYVALMQGNVRMSLSSFIEEQTMTADLNEIETYHYEPKKEKLLTQEIELPKDWNDIVFLFGKFISSNDVADAEMLLNAFINQKHLFPEDYSEQLQPYGKQLEKGYFDVVYQYYMSTFLQQKIQNFNAEFNMKNKPYQNTKTLLLIYPFLNAVQKRMDSGKSLPMLSFPSHLPHWVAPKVLVERLIAHQKEGVEIDKLDLSIAISRMPPENTEEALPLLQQLNGEIKDLMTFCLGQSKKITFKTDSLLNKLLSKVSLADDEHLKAVWAVAARTFYPQETFTEFEGTYLEEIPFAVAPFNPVITAEERWNEYLNYQTNKKERSPSWYELTFHLPGYKNIPQYFLYGMDLFGKKNSWEYSIYNEGNVYYWESLMPQNSDALACFLLRSSCNISSNGGQELKGFLNVINRPGFRFSDLTMLTFACSLFQDKKDIRMIASEVLINLVEQRAIDLSLFSEKLNFLVANKYGPFLRLVESLGSLKDISPLHNSAFLQMMENVFKGMDTQEKLPVNFKKMVEHYIDVLFKTNQQPDPEVIIVFEKLKDNAVLKTLVKQILK